MQPVVNVVLLAGGRPFAGAPCKALAPIAGQPMVARIARTLRQSGMIGQIVAVGPAEALRAVLDDTIPCIEQADSLLANICLGIENLPQDKLVLICAADVPHLTTDAVEDLITAGLAYNAECVYPFVSQQDIEASYPGAKRTYLRMKEGRFTGGNLQIVSPEGFMRNRELVDQLTGNRKSPIKLVLQFGVGALIRLAFGQLSIAAAQKAASRMVGARVLAYQSRFACIGQDVDRPEDLALMEATLPDALRDDPQPAPAAE